MSRLSLMIDLERCIGCKSCEAACKLEHGLGAGEYRTRVVWLGGALAELARFLPIPCQQCERPACLRACGVNPKAIHKDEVTGMVRVIEERCTGCGECVAACPYGAMGYDAPGHHAVKCDLCQSRREQGQQPACVSVCPGYALEFGEREYHLEKAAETRRQVRDQDGFLLGPGTVYLEPLPREEGLTDIATNGSGRVPAMMEAPPPGLVGAAEFPFGHHRAERESERSVPGGCNICFNACSIRFHFQGERLVKITGNEEDPLFQGKVCPKSQMTMQLYNNRERLRTPLKRVGRRGEGKFRPISWEQALDEIAEKMLAVRERWGNEALGIFTGTRTGLMVRGGYSRIFAQMWGTPNVEGTDPFCASGKSVAYTLTQGQVGSGNSFTADDLGSASLYVFFGENMAETRPVYFGMINHWRIQNQARMVVIDPRRSVTASKADRWLPIRTGTDMALGLAMIYHLFSTDRYDRTFCENWVVGWEQWRDYVLDKGYSPQWAEGVTDLPAAEIERLAGEIAEAERCVIFASRGINQHTNSVQTNRVLMFLAAMTGNWGKKGGAYFNTIAGLLGNPPSIPGLNAVPPEKPKIRHSPSGWVDAMRSGKPYPLRALIACNNPMSNWPGQKDAREAFEALDLLVHIELFKNETSAFADYVLPAATGIEQGDLGRGSCDRRIVWIDKLIDPPGEARADAWIWVELGRRFGFEEVLKPEYADPAVFWDEVFIQNEYLRGCTQKRLHQAPHRWVRTPVPSEDSEEQETLFLEGTTALGAPEGHRFPTPSGKLEFFTEDLEGRFAELGLSALPEFYGEREMLVDLPHLVAETGDDQPGVASPFFRVPTWASRVRIVSPTDSAPGRELRERGFTTELVTGRPPAPHFHSWTHYFWQAQEMWPDLFVQMHPELAGERGIQDGERVRVSTAHGAIEAVAWVDAGIRPEAVFIPMGWGEQQPFHPWRSVNFLSDRSQRCPVSDQTNLKTLLCNVERL